MIAICNPDLHKDPTVVFAAYHPMRKRAMPLITTEIMAPVVTSLPTKMNGNRGINEPTTVDAPTRIKLRRGSNICAGSGVRLR